MTEGELRLLSYRATEWGITDDQFEQALEDALTGRVEFTVPPDDKGRRELLMDMIRMMAADGKVSPPEKKLFAVAATLMGMTTDELNALIDTVVRDEVE